MGFLESLVLHYMVEDLYFFLNVVVYIKALGLTVLCNNSLLDVLFGIWLMLMFYNERRDVGHYILIITCVV